MDMWKTFVHPTGADGQRGADLMERTGGAATIEAVDYLGLQPGDRVLEIGHGPGLGIEYAATQVGSAGFVAGVDHSELMTQRAATRNAQAITDGLVLLVTADVTQVPLEATRFDHALAIDNAHFWPDPVMALLHLRRALRPGGQLMIGFSPMSGGSTVDFHHHLSRAAFTRVRSLRLRSGTFLHSTC